MLSFPLGFMFIDCRETTHLGAVQSSRRHGNEWMVLRRSLFSLLTRSCSIERSCSTCADRDSTWFCRVSMVPVKLEQKEKQEGHTT